jgi:chromosome segregation ATPase
VSGLQAQLAQAMDEQATLRASNDSLTAEQARTLTEQQQEALRELERSHLEFLSGLQAQLAQATAEQATLRAANEALTTKQAQILAEHTAGRAELERALASAQAQAEARLLRQDQDLAEVRRQLAEVLSDREGLAVMLERGEKARSAFEAERGLARADASAVRQQLDELLKRHEQRQEEMTHLQQTLTNAERETKRLAELLEQQDVLAAELRAEITDGRADNKRLQMLLAESEAHQMRLTADYSAERLRTRRELADAIGEHNRVMKTLVDDNVELRHVRDSARALESLAATGRLAREIGSELHGTIDQLNAHSTELLTLTSLEAVHRAGVEALRLDALRAAELARQLMLPDPRLPSAASGGGHDAVPGSLAK